MEWEPGEDLELSYESQVWPFSSTKPIGVESPDNDCQGSISKPTQYSFQA